MSWLVAETSGIGIIVDAVQSVHFRNARVCAKARVRKTNGVDAVACHARHVQKIPFEHLLAELHSLGQQSWLHVERSRQCHARKHECHETKFDDVRYV
jgi:hypothetical protein